MRIKSGGTIIFRPGWPSEKWRLELAEEIAHLREIKRLAELVMEERAELEYPDDDIPCCHYCGRQAIVKAAKWEIEDHAEDCPWDRLRRALKGG